MSVSWVHAVVDVPGSSYAVAADFWARVLGWPVGSPWDGHPELSSFEPPSGSTYLHLQRLGSPPTGAARVHLDVEAEVPAETVRRAVSLGAVVSTSSTDGAGSTDGEGSIDGAGSADGEGSTGGEGPADGEGSTDGGGWTTLRSPGGLAFCVVPAGSQGQVEPLVHPDGHRSRMVQVCVDSPPSRHDREVEFWRALLAGRWSGSGRAEFAGKWHDGAGSPIQLLFQRLDEDDGPVRAHLDHGTDDLDAEVRRVLTLGATDLGRGAGGWHVLRDPTGMVFCVTRNSPEHVGVRDLG